MDIISSRRKFLKTMAAGMIGGEIIYGAVPSVFAKNEIPKDGFEVQKGYKVFNETTQKNMLRLAEELIPGCSSVGMKDKLMNYVYINKGIASFLDAGFWNIDAISRAKFKSPFYSLQDRDAVNRIMKYVSLRNKSFFYNFRKLVIQFYYSDPQVWKKLSYNGPPQPNGFMDYAEAPKADKKSK